MDQPKYLNEYINQLLFDAGQLNPHHLQAIRIGLSALYKRIKYINIYADLNENLIELVVKFKWWAIFTKKKKFLYRIREMLKNSLPKPIEIVDMRDGQPIVEQTEYNIKVGILKRKDRVKWIGDGKEKNRSE